MFVIEKLDSQLLSGGPARWIPIFEAKKKAETKEFLQSEIDKGRSYPAGKIRLVTITKNGPTAVTYQP